MNSGIFCYVHNGRSTDTLQSLKINKGCVSNIQNNILALKLYSAKTGSLYESTVYPKGSRHTCKVKIISGSSTISILLLFVFVFISSCFLNVFTFSDIDKDQVNLPIIKARSFYNDLYNLTIFLQ